MTQKERDRLSDQLAAAVASGDWVQVTTISEQLRQPRKRGRPPKAAKAPEGAVTQVAPKKRPKARQPAPAPTLIAKVAHPDSVPFENLGYLQGVTPNRSASRPPPRFVTWKCGRCKREHEIPEGMASTEFGYVCDSCSGQTR